MVVRSLYSVLKLFLPEGKLIGVCSLLTSMQAWLTTCERSGYDQAAKLKSSMRSGAVRSPDSSHRQ